MALAVLAGQMRAGWEIGVVDPLWQAVLWSVIPVALLLLATAVSAYGFKYRRPRPQEDPVGRAYFDARAHAASTTSEPAHRASRHLPASSR